MIGYIFAIVAVIVVVPLVILMVRGLGPRPRPTAYREDPKGDSHATPAAEQARPEGPSPSAPSPR